MEPSKQRFQTGGGVGGGGSLDNRAVLESNGQVKGNDDQIIKRHAREGQ